MSLDARPGAGSDPRRGRVWDRVLDALSLVETGKTADGALKKVETRARDLGSSERRAVREAVFGLLRRRRVIEDALARAARSERKDLELLEPPLMLKLLLLASRERHEAQEIDPRVYKRFSAILERVFSERLPPFKGTELERAAVEANVPTWVYTRWTERLGAERTKEIAAAFGRRAPLTVYVTSAEDPGALVARLRERGIEASLTASSPRGLNLPVGTDLARLTERDSLVVQDEGSQLIALAARPERERARVLDACAGAGGKTIVLADQSHGAEIVALEPDAYRWRELQRRVKSGAKRERAHLEDHARAHPGRYDVVLVDAPCTGVGTLRRHPELAYRLEPEHLEAHRARQQLLLTAAATATAPEGRIVYATCSIFAEENEDVIDAFLSQSRGAFAPEPVFTEALAEILGRSSRLRIGPGPEPSGPDGYFIAALRRVSGG